MGQGSCAVSDASRRDRCQRWLAVSQPALGGVGPGRSLALTGAKMVRLRAVVGGVDLRLGPVSGLSQLLSDRCVCLSAGDEGLSGKLVCGASRSGRCSDVWDALPV